MALVRLRSVKEAVVKLQAGELVIYPTETAYGLGADACNEQALERIFVVKGRPKRRTLPIIVSDLNMAEQFGVLNSAAKALAQTYWPGPLTLVVKAKKLPSLVTQDGTVAMRVSGHATARALSRQLGRPIISTSANLSAHGNIYSLSTLSRQLGHLADTLYVLDAGTLPRRKPTTIVRPDAIGTTIIRQGGIHLPTP